MHIEIRKANASHIPFLQDIARGTISSLYRSFLEKKDVSAAIDAVAADFDLLENISEYDVLLIDAGLVGFSRCQADRIAFLMIADGFHRQGLGSRLLKHCETQLFRRHPKIKIDSFEGNKKAHFFLLKNGWEEAGNSVDEKSGTNKRHFVKTKQDGSAGI
ncbi:MAG: GNAT family N-acetyltransferase [Nitrospiria bacterium]